MLRILFESTVENVYAISEWTEFLFKKIIQTIDSESLDRMSSLLHTISYSEDREVKKQALYQYKEEMEAGDFFPHIVLSQSIPAHIYELFDKDFKQFLKSFESSNKQLELYFYAEPGSKKGGYSSQEKAIWLNMLHPFFFKQYKDKFMATKRLKKAPELGTSLLYKFLDDAGHLSTFAHELQHAYDDWRSKGKAIARSKSHMELQTQADDKKAPESLKKKARNQELNHPSEVWGRMQEVLQLIINPKRVSDKIIIQIYYGPSSINDLWAKWFNEQVHQLFLNVHGYDRQVEEKMKKRTYKVFAKILHKRMDMIRAGKKIDNMELINKMQRMKKGNRDTFFDNNQMKLTLQAHQNLLGKLHYKGYI